ncbi:Transcription elongation factor SPT6, partial [Chaetura pelagica]
MSDFVESEAEESEEEYNQDGEVVPRVTKKFVEEDEDDEEEEEENLDDQDEQGNLKGFINDDDDEEEEEEEEASDSGDSEDNVGHKKRKRTFDDRLEDDDFDLIEENLGVKVKRQKFRRVRKMSDDEDDEEEDYGKEEHEKEAIAEEIFQDGEGEEGGEAVEAPVAPPEEEEEEEEDESDIDDFIVDDDGQPLKKPKWRKKLPGYTDAALQEAQEIFGVDFDYDEFEKYNEYDEELEEEYDYEDEEAEGETRVRPKKAAKKRVSRRSIFEMYEPSELESSHLTDQDNEIRMTDMPERFQLRSIPVKSAEDDELEEEADWIYRNAFATPTISLQESCDYLDRGQASSSFSRKGPSTIQKIKEALNFMRNQHFEVPFIAFYRKEYVEPELHINDLWRVWQWDEK